MPVGNLGPKDVATVNREATVSEVVDMLSSENVGSVVVAEDGKPAGIVTDRDVALAVNEMDELATESVESIMTTDPVTLHEGDEDMEISRTIEEEGVRRIPVVDDNDELTGIVTLDDLVATVGEQLDNASNTIENQSPDYEP